jgi:hypothetical protein
MESEAMPKQNRKEQTIRWAILCETKLKMETEESAEQFVESFGRIDIGNLANSKFTVVEKFKILHGEPDPSPLELSQTIDTAARAGTTENKVKLKACTVYAEPSKDGTKEKIEKLLKWFEDPENLAWAGRDNLHWYKQFKRYYEEKGFLTDGQFNSLKKTKNRIQYKTRVHGRAFYKRLYDEALKEGKPEKAEEIYEKHLKK